MASSGGVVHRGTGQRDGADLGAGEPAVVDDAGEHRERGDGAGRADEHGGLPGGDVVGEPQVAAGQIPAEQPADDDRREDAGRRGDGGLPEVPGEDGVVELQADHEHVEDQAELARDEQRRQGRVLDVGGRPRHGEQPREEVVEQGGEDMAEQGGAEQEARRHVGDDLRLAQPAQQQSQQPAHGQDGGQLHEEQHGQFVVGGHLTRFRRRGPRSSRTRRSPHGRAGRIRPGTRGRDPRAGRG
jgi:hypothetical protein